MIQEKGLGIEFLLLASDHLDRLLSAHLTFPLYPCYRNTHKPPPSHSLHIALPLWRMYLNPGAIPELCFERWRITEEWSSGRCTGNFFRVLRSSASNTARLDSWLLVRGMRLMRSTHFKMISVKAFKSLQCIGRMMVGSANNCWLARPLQRSRGHYLMCLKFKFSTKPWRNTKPEITKIRELQTTKNPDRSQGR